MFSILIPSWNNINYLKLCIDSIKKNSTYPHQIIVHVNDGSDGTIEYLKSIGVAYTQSNENIGICYAVNLASSLANQPYIVYLNDDMYVCPQWDKHIVDEINKLEDDNFMFSGTLIEPNNSNNPCVIVKNYGVDNNTFEEEKLIKEYTSLHKNDWCGSAWPPTIVSRNKWIIVGGYSTELSPGMSSDDDFAMKMWQSGCRIFKGIGASKIYHFQAKSTLRIKKNKGRRQFLQKWGLNQSTFNKYYLRRGDQYLGPLTEPDQSIIAKEKGRARLKTILLNLKSAL